MSDIINRLKDLLGAPNVLTDTDDCAPFLIDPTGKYQGKALGVIKPANTQDVSKIVKLANETGTPVIPQGGNTGLAGGSYTGQKKDHIIISMARMNHIREIRPEGRIAIVEAGVVLASLHQAAEQHGLIFPLMFGARGSCMIGGNLATNAGGSNVVRFGNTRDLVLGIEVVMPNGDIVDQMSELHKDNSGYNLKHLMIGSEGTLGIITAAVLKLSPQPKAYFTATVSVPDLATSVTLLNRLKEATNNGVEAFEYMPQVYFDALCDRFPDMRQPFSEPAEHGIFLEIGATNPTDAAPLPDGTLPIVNQMEALLMEFLEDGQILDAVICKSEAQRQEMWDRRERAFEVTLTYGIPVNNDISVAVDKVALFLELMEQRLPLVAPNSQSLTVAHLGDGNLHFSVWPDSETKRNATPEESDRIMELVEETVLKLGGSFSAEHGIGLTKLPSMARRKNKNALVVMKSIKAALDPNNIMNPGKLLPDT